MDVVYYAHGGGHGHVLRGLALLQRLGRGLLCGPARLLPWARACGVEYRADALPTLGASTLLLADVFPRGVTGELAPLLGRCPAWLVTRWVQPGFYLHPPVRHAIEHHFERLVWTEAPVPELRGLCLPQDEVEPVLVRHEPLPREEARQALGGEGEARPLVLALASGDASRQVRFTRLMEKVAARLDVGLRVVGDERPLFPAARYLAGADAVVSAGGYHAVHELRAAGVPAVFIPQRRRYDDQFRRVQGEAVAGTPEELEEALGRLLRQGRRTGARPPDGAAQLAKRVESRVQKGILV